MNIKNLYSITTYRTDELVSYYLVILGLKCVDAHCNPFSSGFYGEVYPFHMDSEEYCESGYDFSEDFRTEEQLVEWLEELAEDRIHKWLHYKEAHL